MTKTKTLLIILIVGLIFSLFSGFAFSRLWLIQQLLWLALSLTIYNSFIKDQKSNYRNTFILVVISYLIIESLLKITIFYSDGGWLLLNTIEHLIWSLFFSVLIYYPLKVYLKDKNLGFVLFMLIAIINLVGVGNELVEFILRDFGRIENLAYYSDTIRDMFMNIVGSSIFAIIIFVRGKPVKK